MTKINDPPLQKTITVAQAYLAMVRFIEQYHGRGASSTSDLVSDVGLRGDGEASADPAQIDDFLRAVNYIRSTSAAAS